MQCDHKPQKYYIFKNQFEIDVKTSLICPQDRALPLAKQMHMNTALWLAYTEPGIYQIWIMFTLYTETETLFSIFNIGPVRDKYKCFRNVWAETSWMQFSSLATIQSSSMLPSCRQHLCYDKFLYGCLIFKVKIHIRQNKLLCLKFSIYTVNTES